MEKQGLGAMASTARRDMYGSSDVNERGGRSYGHMHQHPCRLRRLPRLRTHHHHHAFRGGLPRGTPGRHLHHRCWELCVRAAGVQTRVDVTREQRGAQRCSSPTPACYATSSSSSMATSTAAPASPTPPPPRDVPTLVWLLVVVAVSSRPGAPSIPAAKVLDGMSTLQEEQSPLSNNVSIPVISVNDAVNCFLVIESRQCESPPPRTSIFTSTVCPPVHLWGVKMLTKQLQRSIHFLSLSECGQTELLFGLFVYKDALFSWVCGKRSVPASGHDLLPQPKPPDQSGSNVANIEMLLATGFALWDPGGSILHMLWSDMLHMSCHFIFVLLGNFWTPVWVPTYTFEVLSKETNVQFSYLGPANQLKLSKSASVVLWYLGAAWRVYQTQLQVQVHAQCYHLDMINTISSWDSTSSLHFWQENKFSEIKFLIQAVHVQYMELLAGLLSMKWAVPGISLRASVWVSWCDAMLMQPNSSVVIILCIFQELTDMLLWKGLAHFPHRPVHENCGHKGRQLVKNKSFATSTLMQPLLDTNSSAQIFYINTFQNEASEAMIKCEDCLETRNRLLELLDAGVVVNGSVLAVGEQLWPDNIFIQDQNTSTPRAVIWADLSCIPIRATNASGCTFIFDPGGRIVIFGRVEEQLHISNLPLRVDIRRHLSSVHRLEGKPNFKRRGMSWTGPWESVMDWATERLPSCAAAWASKLGQVENKRPRAAIRRKGTERPNGFVFLLPSETSQSHCSSCYYPGFLLLLV